MAYNLTPLYAADTSGDLFSFANASTDGWLFGLLLIAVFMVLVMQLKKWDFVDAIISSSFVCFVLALFMTYAGLINWFFIVVFIVLLACGILAKASWGE